MIIDVFMLDRIIVTIGGGELKTKTTLDIDGYIAALANARKKGERANGLFIGTASHDSMPYFNSFRKTYTSVYNVKVDCALIVHGEMDVEKISNKISVADFIYVGGGDTMFMLDVWKKTGLDKLILQAYKNGTILCGLSAGAICWFEKMFSDSEFLTSSDEYNIYDGFALLKGICSPHYNHRKDDFLNALKNIDFTEAYAIEDNAALVFTNSVFTKSLSSGGSSYKITKENDTFNVQMI